MQQLFSYQQATQEQINAHVAKLCPAAIRSALVRYTSAGNVEITRKLRLAVTLAKIARLQAEAEELLRQSTENSTAQERKNNTDGLKV